MINLREFTQGDHPFGNFQGREVLQKLLAFVDQHPTQTIFEISLEDIKATDASFPRESVVSLAKQLRGEKGFYLTHFSSQDLVDNWNYAAQAKEQPLTVWDSSDHRFIGPEIKPATKDLLDFVVSSGKATTSSVATALDISVQNASTRLKKLVNQGFIMRQEDIAETGGTEFVYAAIK